MASVAERPRLLLLCLAVVTTAAGVLQARAQPDSIGFISIDCGLPGTASYVDDTTKLVYVPDAAFIDAGSNYNISAEYMTPTVSKRYYNVRSFPDGVRNCYTLRSIVPGLKYLLRATFKYGNYDGLSQPPVFDLYIGVNFWTMVNITDAESAVLFEAIVLVPDDFVQVCLVNTGAGTPFISGLDLRPLKSTLYPQVNATQGLVLFNRLNFGPIDETDIVRYPDDPYDRAWIPWVNTATWNSVSTTLRVEDSTAGDDVFEVPIKVTQTAITPRNVSENIEFSWDPEPQPKDPTPGYIANMHFSELVKVQPGNSVRQFYINLNGKQWYPKPFTPMYLISKSISNSNPVRGIPRYSISINATANSTLPPTINAIEVFSVIATTNVGTDSQDVSAITAIKVKYGVKKNWMGDPCVPKDLAWDGLACSYSISSPPRITSVNLSFSGLNGDISSSFANLKAVQYMDLSHNNLAGSVPDSLSQLTSLAVLDLTDNKLSGSIPPGLLKRIQGGSLNLRYDDNQNLCTNGNSCQTTKRKSMLTIYIVVPVVLVTVIVSVAVLLLCFCRRNKQGSSNSAKPQDEMPMSHAPTSASN